MSSRRLFLVLGLALLAGAVVWWLLPQPGRLPPAAPSTASVSTPATLPVPAAPAPPAGTIERPRFVDSSPVVSVAAELNSPRHDIVRDLSLLNDLLTDWRLNFPNVGNPWGDNAEITAALTGENSLGLRLIARSHPAINADGELVDRWGTPFRFHALAGDRMELRSAGPDKKFGTPDDALLAPPPVPGSTPLL